MNEPEPTDEERHFRREVLKLLSSIIDILEEIRDSTDSTEQQLSGPGVRIRS